MARRGNKYGAKKTIVDGIKFDSGLEARRWMQLKLLESAGHISSLRRQVVIFLQGRNGPLLTRTGRKMRLTVDFSYIDLRTGKMVHEDAKGAPTRDYDVRRSVAAAQGIDIVEIKKA